MRSRESIPWIGLLSLLAIGLWLQPAQAGQFQAAQYRANQSLTSCQAVERLADFLVDCQVPAGADTVGWTWEVDQGQIAPNMAGLVSLALLDSYQATGQLRYLRAAQRYADGLLNRAQAQPVHKSDVELMVRLFGVFDDPAYRQAALDQFGMLRSRASDGAAEVARIEAGRKAHPALLGYDVALAIRAALAVDERVFAYQLADAVLARSGAWYQPKQDPRFTLVSAAALVSALESLDEAQYRATTSRLRADLAKAQTATGAWQLNETQPTAYAVLALLYSPQASERQAAARGLFWLKTGLLKAGSLAAFNDRMPEPFVGQILSGVNAEALTALAAACTQERRER